MTELEPHEQEMYERIKTLVLTADLDEYGDKYHQSHAKGVTILYDYKSLIERDRYAALMRVLSLEIYYLIDDNVRTDLMDEIHADLVHFNPPPYFWDSTFEEYKQGNFIKRFFLD